MYILYYILDNIGQIPEDKSKNYCRNLRLSCTSEETAKARFPKKKLDFH